MDANKHYPLSHGNMRTYNLEDKEFWDDLFIKRAEWLKSNGFSEGLRNYDFMDGPYSRIWTERFDYYPDSGRDPLDFTDDSFAAYADTLMQYQRRFAYLEAKTELGEQRFFFDRSHVSEKFDYQVKIKFSDDFKVIRKTIIDQCNQIIEAVKQHKSDQWHFCRYPEDYLRDKNGKKIPPGKLFTLWEKCLNIYLLYEKCGNKSQVSRDMGMFDEDIPGSSVNLITRHLIYTSRLMKAAASGNFFTEAAKPFTAGRVREKREGKRKK